ncbi:MULTISPECIES: oxygenase MpaB family protein [unclassified Frankia]|uniref:oxygenase MpaB family protein n=1 Tax=unclassified Frankia TaxID=2632575 RepID=UPI002024CD04
MTRSTPWRPAAGTGSGANVNSDTDGNRGTSDDHGTDSGGGTDSNRGADSGGTDAGPAPDAGLFGPASVTWRVHGDPSMIVAGIRALLLQGVHPLAMAGVAQHSAYRADPWGRLLRTATYVETITYGTTAQARQAAERVRRVHTRVRGTEPTSGRPYRAGDPELLLWVHVSEAESFLSTARRCGLRLTDSQADAYFAEQVRAAELIGIPAEDVPDSQAAVAHYFTRMRPHLRVTPQSREMISFILRPPMPRWVSRTTPARPAWSALSAIAAGMLPGWARRLYGLPDTPLLDTAACLGARATRTALLALPRRLRQVPEPRDAVIRPARTRPARPAPEARMIPRDAPRRLLMTLPRQRAQESQPPPQGRRRPAHLTVAPGR